MTACWNQIGVRGDSTCPELVQHVHCRNCPTYVTAARELLNGQLVAADLAERTIEVAAVRPAHERPGQSVVIFRVAAEWFAIPTSTVTEITDPRPVHSLPHRRGGAVLGVASVRGELLVCVSLPRLLGMGQAAGAQTVQRSSPRLLVLRRQLFRALCPADEVYGLHRVSPSELQEVPASVAMAANRISTAIVSWRGHSVGLLDEHLLFQSLQRSLA
jgi:chemotaxis-related protein WspD